ncbi:hypothetical protein N9L28_03725 [Luminiphilus sp.]|nr:hypothetical protein [Luminiphilus sp.]
MFGDVFSCHRHDNKATHAIKQVRGKIKSLLLCIFHEDGIVTDSGGALRRPSVSEGAKVKRTVWMFPRCKRSAPPTELGLLVRSLSNALAQSAESTLDQEGEDAWLETVAEFELKSGGAFQHIASGGGRTYIAYLEQMGLIFKRLPAEEGAKPQIFLTLAGRELADLKNPARVIRHQVLSLQFPSPYSKARGVGICPSVKVRPSIFVCEMLSDKRLGNMLGNEEVALACIYGRSHADLDKVINKCLKARSFFKASTGKPTRWDALLSVIDDPYPDLYSQRTKTDHPDRSWQLKRIKGVVDDANALVNRMYSAGILIRDLNESAFKTSAYRLNRQHSAAIEAVSKLPINDGKNYKPGEAWQRRLGKYDSDKDIRKDVTCRTYDLQSPEERFRLEVLSQYTRLGTLFDYEKFCREFSSKTGMDITDAKRILDAVLPEAEDDLEYQLLLTSSDDKRHRDFELCISYVLQKKFPECDVKHLGQLKRSDKTELSHDYADVVIRNPAHKCIFIDAKATRNGKPYSYNAGDVTKSEGYVKYPGEAVTDPELDTVEAFLIIAPQFSQGAYKRAALSAERTQTPFKLMDVRDFLHKMRDGETNYDGFLSSLSA